MSGDTFTNAMTARSLKNIKTELEFLKDSNFITPQQFDSIVEQLRQLPATANGANPQPPVQQMRSLEVSNNAPVSEKKVGYYAQNSNPNPPPPAYPSAPAAPAGPPVLAHATAMYQYNAQDAGDLALIPNDRVVVHEFMNNEWWKGRNERTGQEGIFPASYVRREDVKAMPPPGAMAPQPSNYGNMPLDVSNGAANQPPPPQENQAPSKGAEMGKKVGKKLGNAAIFGAGATMGSNLVNSIF